MVIKTFILLTLLLMVTSCQSNAPFGSEWGVKYDEIDKVPRQNLSLDRAMEKCRHWFELNGIDMDKYRITKVNYSYLHRLWLIQLYFDDVAISSTSGYRNIITLLLDDTSDDIRVVDSAEDVRAGFGY